MTIKEALKYSKQELQKAGLDDSAFDAIYLTEYILGLNRTDIALNQDKEIDNKKSETLKNAIKKRISGIPLQYIIGEWEFMGRTYCVGEGVLIPRDDTEVVVRSCIDLLKQKANPTIVDLCSGSGIIAITLKKMFINSTLYAVEKSEHALPYLKKNCEINNADVKIIFDDINLCFDKFDNNCLDMIVSNPPYIITDDIKTLQKEVQKEPAMALDGGADGYDFYRAIIDKWSDKLKIGGIIAFEIGEGQRDYIHTLLKNHGFSDIKDYYDLSSTVRAITAVYTKN